MIKLSIRSFDSDGTFLGDSVFGSETSGEISHRLFLGGSPVPASTTAVLFDMDGTLFDTLSMDFQVVDELIRQHVGDFTVPRAVIRRYFPCPLPEFWRGILRELEAPHLDADIEALVAAHESERRTVTPVVVEGVVDALEAVRKSGLEVAVVSNNPEADVRQMLRFGGLLTYVSEVIGNDVLGMASKPAPDLYLEAARRIGASPAACVAIEDSVVGLRAAEAAGCYAIGVATGSDCFAVLAASGHADRVLLSLVPPSVSLGRLGITSKVLQTPNDFVSHMVEHIAWRLGCSIDLRWTNDDWAALGTGLGAEVAALGWVQNSAAALGMIDDGSAEVLLRLDSEPGARFTASPDVDLAWFLSVRCEQLIDGGGPLVELLDAIAKSTGLRIDVTIGSFEDPHHTWEGVYRAVGIALDRMCNPPALDEPMLTDSLAEVARNTTVQAVEAGWCTEFVSAVSARLTRETAESAVSVEVALSDTVGAQLQIEVGDSVHVTGLADLLDAFAVAAGLRLTVRFEATRLSSSHVITEDVGMVVGRALRAVAVQRMSALGINGAGSNLRKLDDASQAVRVGLSMEGRKFWKYVPFGEDYPTFRRNILIGHTVNGDLFSEDLDDFIDGFAGGMQASVAAHIDVTVGPEAGWPMIFAGLGAATRELMSRNPHRKALTPGVKATLA